MTLVVLTRIGPVSLAKFQGIVFALIGFIVGLIMGLASLVLGSLLGSLGTSGSHSAIGIFGGLGLAAILVIPLLYGAIGFIAGLISAWIFNMIAKWIGGIELNINEKDTQPISNPPPTFNPK